MKNTKLFKINMKFKFKNLIIKFKIKYKAIKKIKNN